MTHEQCAGIPATVILVLYHSTIVVQHRFKLVAGALCNIPISPFLNCILTYIDVFFPCCCAS